MTTTSVGDRCWIRTSITGSRLASQIQLDWKATSVNKNSMDTLESVLKRYESVFSDELGHIHPYQANLCMKPRAKPKFHRPRPAPYAIKEAIGEKLDRMEADGIIEKITHSDWAAPIVAVPKRDGNLGYVETIRSRLIQNSMLINIFYPNPKIFLQPLREVRSSPP